MLIDSTILSKPPLPSFRKSVLIGEFAGIQIYSDDVISPNCFVMRENGEDKLIVMVPQCS